MGKAATRSQETSAMSRCFLTVITRETCAVNSAHRLLPGLTSAIITPDLFVTMSSRYFSASLFQMLFTVRKPTAVTVGSAFTQKSAPKSSETKRICVYLLPTAALTDDHKLLGLTEHKHILLSAVRSQV